MNNPIPETQVVTRILNQGIQEITFRHTTDSDGHPGGIEECELVAEEP